MTTSPFLSTIRDDFERLWLRCWSPAPAGDAGPSDDCPPPSFVRFDPAVLATAASHIEATRAAARNLASLAAAARSAGASAESLLGASAANGMALASTAVGLAAVDAAARRGATLMGASPGETPQGASPLDDPAVTAALAPSPATPEDEDDVLAFVSAHPVIGLQALLGHASAGEGRAASLLRRIEATGSMAAPLAAAREGAAAADRAADAALLALLRGRSVQTIDDGIALMHAIEAQLPEGDGLRAFNMLYRMVTESVADGPPWEDAAWLLRLDVLFANLYFDGIERCLASPDTAPAAWRALMDRRRRTGIARVQFALAGMSAHINRDLAVAVVQTWQAQGTSDHSRATPQFRDYKRVDDVLDRVEPLAMRQLATGLFKVVDGLLAPADGWVAMQILHAARDVAWSHAEVLGSLGLDTDAGKAYVGTLDAVAADVAIAATVTAG